MLRVTVSIPHAKLNPNYTRNHMAKHRLKQEHKEESGWATTVAIHAYEGQHGPLSLPWDVVTLRYVFFHPNRIRRDDDNLIGSMKAARDGLKAGGLLADDYRVTLLPIERNYDAARPRVEMEVERV